MNYRKFLMLSLTALVLSACGGGGGSHRSDDPVVPEVVNPGLVGGPIVISHRGASGYLPEHTLAAYELAIQMGADYIEPDLQFTRDGHLVAMHDDCLDRTTNVVAKFSTPRGGICADVGVYPVSDFTLAEIKSLTVNPPAGSTASTSYPGFTPSDSSFKIPTFEEVIEFSKAQSIKYGRQIGIYPEAKQADPDMEDGILNTLAAYEMDKADSPVFIQSFSEPTIASLHAKQQKQGTKVPQILLGVVVVKDGVPKMGVWRDTVTWAEDSIEALDFAEVKKIADGVSVGLGDPYYTDGFPVTREFIDEAHKAGLRVHGWTFDKVDAIAAQKEFREYLDMGMDGMFSNYPDLAILARDQFSLPNDKFTTSGPTVTSHRGASGYLPEHSLAAYELAIQMRVDYIEPDLQFTSDGVLVAMHDDCLDRTTNVATVFPTPRGGRCTASSTNPGLYPVSDFTLAEIKTLAVVPQRGIGSGTSSDSYPGFTPSMADPFKVPTFDEVIDFAKAQSVKYGRPVGIYPEAKQADPAMEDGILTTLAAKGMDTATSPVIIQSFSGQTIKNLHDKQQARGTQVTQIVLGAALMDNGVAKLLLVYPGDTLGGTNQVTMAAVKEVADGVSVTIGGGATYPVTQEWVDQAHAAGLIVHGWTFDKVNANEAAEEYFKYLDMGMDGYFSNYPNLGVLARDRFVQR
jgi:glycerophosphoryl diester phosphodiesterase